MNETRSQTRNAGTARTARRWARLVAAPLLAATALSTGLASTAGAIPTEPIDRTPPPRDQLAAHFLDLVEPRYRDNNGDGFPDPARSASEAVAPPLAVRLDACGSSGGDSPVTAFVWSVNGTARRDAACSFTWNAPGSGAYPVSLTIETADGDKASVTRTVSVRDLLLVSIGDSLGSGEGNPAVPAASGGPVWESTQCHRSHNAGSAKAAKAIEDSDLSTSVTFVHLACSGAKITTGLLEPYGGIEPDKGQILPPQLDALKAIVGDRPIDALMVSIGINDLDFGHIAAFCVEFDNCENNQAELVDGPIQRVVDGYPRLQTRLRELFPNLPSNRVFLNEYPDNTRRPHPELGSDFCEAMLEDADGKFFWMSIDYDEAKWASANVIGTLNQKVKDATTANKWTLVDHYADQFPVNGYCTDDSLRMFRRYQESKTLQGNHTGALHPNGRGHDILRTRILDKVRPFMALPPTVVVKDLAIGGTSLTGTAPRIVVSDPVGITAAPTVRLDGNPYASGTAINAAGPHTLTVSATSVTGPSTTVTIPFTLVAGQPASLTVSPTSVVGGAGSSGTVVLNGTAPAGGTVVNLSSNNPAVGVPASVRVPAGSNRVGFTLSTTPVASDRTATLTAGAGGATRAATLTVTAPRLEALFVDPTTVPGGMQATGTVQLTSAAPAGGVTVALSSSNPSVASVPASVTVPAGSRTAAFTVTTTRVTTSATVSLTATANGVSRTASLTVERLVIERPPCLKCPVE